MVNTLIILSAIVSGAVSATLGAFALLSLQTWYRRAVYLHGLELELQGNIERINDEIGFVEDFKQRQQSYKGEIVNDYSNDVYRSVRQNDPVLLDRLVNQAKAVHSAYHDIDFLNTLNRGRIGTTDIDNMVAELETIQSRCEEATSEIDDLQSENWIYYMLYEDP